MNPKNFSNKYKVFILLTLFAILTFLLFITNTAKAEVVRNLYKSSILVPNSSASTRQDAAKKTMSQILVRVSGKIDILSAPKCAQYLERAINYISEFRYERTNRKLRLENGAEVWAQMLYLTFDKTAINSIIADLDYGIWDINRPKTLFWILVKNNSKTYLLNNNTNPSLASSLTNNAWSRGLPSYLPKLDRQDARYISATKIWNMDINSALNASKNYGANAVVIARFYRKNNSWNSDWLLQSNKNSKNFTYKSSNLNYLMRLGAYKSVELLADQYAINMKKQNNTSEDIQIKVSKIKNLTDYADLLKYIETRPSVRSANITSLNRDTISLYLKLRVSEAQFLSNISFDKKLLKSPSSGWFIWK